jgi:(p)ppGpp synthase/HD superfamily hydrolase
MVYTDITRKALKLAYERHAGQVDKGGVPYIFHPIHLAEQMETAGEVCVALLHDIVEDTDTTLEEIFREFPYEVYHSVDLLTRKEGVIYRDYIERLKEDYTARKVKIADLKHNMDLTRLPVVTEKDIERQKYYEKFLKILES